MRLRQVLIFFFFRFFNIALFVWKQHIAKLKQTYTHTDFPLSMKGFVCHLVLCYCLVSISDSSVKRAGFSTCAGLPRRPQALQQVTVHSHVGNISGGSAATRSFFSSQSCCKKKTKTSWNKPIEPCVRQNSILLYCRERRPNQSGQTHLSLLLYFLNLF